MTSAGTINGSALNAHALNGGNRTVELVAVVGASLLSSAVLTASRAVRGNGPLHSGGNAVLSLIGVLSGVHVVRWAISGAVARRYPASAAALMSLTNSATAVRRTNVAGDAIGTIHAFGPLALNIGVSGRSPIAWSASSGLVSRIGIGGGNPSRLIPGLYFTARRSVPGVAIYRTSVAGHLDYRSFRPTVAVRTRAVSAEIRFATAREAREITIGREPRAFYVPKEGGWA
ncbi:hypothetical protein C8N35_11627 [Breoghania corrubedonensis]|uniref:Uncharacterized protein n=1 Tax=Breoghania corrubedonensis TaxID=665038 RepID=A0A2T5UQ13_9HYPH|nr:hypothetical protein C8N35_11627 [Breoghania corrubedonensis]